MRNLYIQVRDLFWNWLRLTRREISLRITIRFGEGGGANLILFNNLRFGWLSRRNLNIAIFLLWISLIINIRHFYLKIFFPRFMTLFYLINNLLRPLAFFDDCGLNELALYLLISGLRFRLHPALFEYLMVRLIKRIVLLYGLYWYRRI